MILIPREEFTKLGEGLAGCKSLTLAVLGFMSIAELQKLPSSEKMKIIEALWGDLAAEDGSFESPSWHQHELKKTEADFAAGRVEVMDWETAKKDLRAQFE